MTHSLAEFEPVAPTAAQVWGFALVMSAVAAGLVVFLFRRGVISEKRLRRGRPRPRVFGGVDLVATFLAFAAGVLLSGLLAEAMGLHEHGRVPASRRAWLLALLQVVTWMPVVGYLWVKLRASPIDKRSLGLAPRRLVRQALAAVAALLLFAPVFFAAGSLSTAVGELVRGGPTPVIAHDALQQLLNARQDAWHFAALLLGAVVIAPVFEELAFRGLLQTSLVGVLRGRRWWAIGVTTAIFMLLHLQTEPEAWLGLALLSLALGVLYERTGSIWAPIFLHMLFNGLNVVAAVSSGAAG
ncbi:MAG: CPBP family intramembrane glutamic endopeptidase [Planctomycetota bacterium]